MGFLDSLKSQANDLQKKLNELQNLQNGSSETDMPQSPVPPTPPAPPAPSAQESSSSKQIYNPYLENLIEMALADGELTEKEKQVLFKKAEAQGIDLDEFEMVLDAKLFEKQKSIKTNSANSVQSSAPKSEKYGDVRKCPRCGAIVESFTTRCPDCGHEFSNVGAVSSFSLLSAKLEALDQQASNGIWGEYQAVRIAEKKKALINSFPVPTTKEDILEFVSMATPLGKPALKFKFIESLEDRLAKSWRAKCEQVIMKARFSMKDDKETLAELESYAKELKIK